MNETEIIFKARDSKGEIENITDLYWFEQNYVNDLDGAGAYYNYTIIPTIDTAKKLLSNMSNEDRHEVLGSFCRGCGSIDIGCHCENDI